MLNCSTILMYFFHWTSHATGTRVGNTIQLTSSALQGTQPCVRLCEHTSGDRAHTPTQTMLVNMHFFPCFSRCFPFHFSCSFFLSEPVRVSWKATANRTKRYGRHAGCKEAKGSNRSCPVVRKGRRTAYVGQGSVGRGD